ncbi:MAG: hypothetical protein H0T15_09240, partial [Thermoleophilaceae bacterium]|nr:hypothetical protein [Thermoleophilaceae bacterium]
MKRVLIPAVALLAWVGCGGEAPSPGSGADAQALTGKLNPKTPAAAAVDLTEVREALDLPADADPRKERELLFLAGLAIAPLQSPKETPVGDAIDFGQVSAAAGGGLFSPTAVNVLASGQDFDEIAEKLGAEGFRRDGDVLVTDRPAFEAGASAVAGGDGLIALATTPGEARAALEREEDETPLARALELVDGPVRAASVAADQSCFESYAASDEVKPQGGEVVIQTKEDASAEGFALAKACPFGEAVSFEDPQV